jgi:hypothetical protein
MWTTTLKRLDRFLIGYIPEPDAAVGGTGRQNLPV